MCVALPTLSLEVNQIHTTFGLVSDVWPMTLKEVSESDGYAPLNDGLCLADTYVSYFGKIICASFVLLIVTQ